MQRRVDVLILTAPFGNGHNSAAQAIIEELGSSNPQLYVHSVDLFDITTPKLKETFAETYHLLTRSQPGLYNRLYDLRTRAPFNPVDNIMFRLTFEKFLDYVEPLRPRTIISVFPTGAAFASAYQNQVDPGTRLITCITDVVDNWEWIYPNTDLYLVASESVRSRLQEKGIEKDAILVTGVPVRKAFKCTKSGEPEGERDDMRLLILANAMESVKLDETLLEELAQIRKLHTVIITGNQKHLHSKLMKLNRWDNIEIVGYTEDMAAYMAKSDLIISKAGGATIFEAIQMELPLLVQHSLVGQENHNVTFVQESGIGELIPQDDQLSARIIALIKNPRSMQTYRRNIRNLKRTLNQKQLTSHIERLLAGKSPMDSNAS